MQPTTAFPNGRSSAPNGGSAPPVNPTKSITQSGFTITTRKCPILKAAPIEEMTTKLGIAPPEMIFGDNLVRIEHTATNWAIEFDAFGALDRVDKTGENMFKVSYSKEWHETRQNVHEDIKEVIKPFDWSYSTDFKGAVEQGSATETLQSTETPIPLALLTRPDPIIFFDEVMLYEDELADNGITVLSCKLRVMPARMLLLCRFFLRLDGVVCRIRDTRVYVEFASGLVVREYTAREGEYEDVRKRLVAKGNREEALTIMRDPQRLVELLPVVEQSRESVTLKA